MTNQFRTLLMNIAEHSPVIINEYISSGFTPRTLPTALNSFRSLLYPSGTRSDILNRTTSYTMLLVGCGLSDVFTIQDTRITYTLDSLSTFGQASYNLETLAESVLVSSVATNMMVYSQNNTEYMNLFQNGLTNLQKLAGLIASYSYKLS